MKAAALRGALSDRARNGRIHVVESLISGEAPSTKTALAALTGLAPRIRFLLVLERTDTITWLSLRNAPEVHIVAVDQLNTYDVLASDDVVFTQGAYEAFVAAAPRGKTADVEAAPAEDAEPAKAEKPAKAAKADKPAKAEKAAETEAPVAFAAVAEDTAEDATDEDAAPALPAGAKAPLKSGKAPKGYDIKGNADSGLYHEPDGRWYDATVAEFWFKSAEDAEAAGFTRAGGAAKKDEEADK
jgi:large subunit ribosomal protein L4